MEGVVGYKECKKEEEWITLQSQMQKKVELEYLKWPSFW